MLFFVNDPGGFAAAVASLTAMGSEDWSSAANAPATPVVEPLLPGVANPPFPHGTNPATGLIAQSNTLGGAASTPSPGAGLFYAPAGFQGVSGAAQPSEQLSANTIPSSFDLFFATAGGTVPHAVQMSPMYYQVVGPSPSATLTVQAYDSGSVLLGSTAVPNVADTSESAFLGVVATAGSTLRRVNLWAGSTDVAGADNITVYGAPEPPSAGGVAALGALAGLRRSRLGAS